MADNFNLINFKRGTLADLQALNTAANRSKIEVGTFYLTIDEGSNAPESTRLFIGREVPNPEGSGTIKKIVPVNQGIVKVNNVTALNENTVEGNFQPGDFAYVETGNIFAIYDGGHWKQINSVGTDTYVNDLSTNITVSSNTATIAQTASYNQGHSDLQSNGMQFTGAGGITLSVTQGATTSSPDVLTFTGDTYEIDHGSVANNTVDLTLTSAQNNNSAITVKGGENITIETPSSGDDEDKIVIKARDTYINDLDFATASQGFTLTGSRNDDSFVTSDTLDPQIVLGTHTNSPIHFVNGVATLDVYTKSEIDQQQKDLDAMTYKGTVGTTPQGSAALSVNEITNVSVGDTFKIVQDGLSLPSTLSSDGTAHTLKAGDILIATGTEANGLITSNLKFDLIPAGDEIDTTYTFSGITHGVSLEPNPGVGSAGSIALVQGDQISLTDGTGATAGDKTITVAHATITKQNNDTDATTATQTVGSTLTIPVISNITLSNGHVTKWTIKNYQVVDTSISLDSLSYSASSPASGATGYQKEATIEGSIGYTGQNGISALPVTGSFKLESDNLTVTTPTPTTTGVPEIKMNLVWGAIPSSAS